MATKRVKGDFGGRVNNELLTVSGDRISQLPDDLIYHIFSFLPTVYIVRMSLISKRWRHLWLCTPFLYFEDFCNITFDKKVKKQDMVLNFATNFFRCRELCMKIPDPLIVSFKCDTTYSFASCGIATRQIDEWLSFAVQNKVKQLDLHVKQYRLPQSVRSANSLTVLKLSEVKLVVPFPPSFPSLKVLSLMCVDSDNKSLQNLISGCTIIEEMLLSGSSLGDMDFTVSGTLRSLSLSRVDLTDKWLSGLISGLPILERLTLKCYKLKNISLCSHSLKFVSIVSLKSIEAAFRTPNLVWLKFACGSDHSIISVEAPNLLEANLYFAYRYMDETSYSALVRFLSNLNFSKKIKLSIWTEEVFIIA